MRGRKRFNKRGQETLGIGFGMIFSILLIIFFILITFIVIKSFLSAQNCARIGIFVDKFKTDVKKTWNSQIDSHTFKGTLPSGIKLVCFGDVTIPSNGVNEEIGYEISLFEGKNANMYFYPIGKTCNIPYHNVPQLDLERVIRKYKL